jgi:hypothetical protein
MVLGAVQQLFLWFLVLFLFLALFLFLVIKKFC